MNPFQVQCVRRWHWEKGLPAETYPEALTLAHQFKRDGLRARITQIVWDSEQTR